MAPEGSRLSMSSGMGSATRSIHAWGRWAKSGWRTSWAGRRFSGFASIRVRSIPTWRGTPSNPPHTECRTVSRVHWISSLPSSRRRADGACSGSRRTARVSRRSPSRSTEEVVAHPIARCRAAASPSTRKESAPKFAAISPMSPRRSTGRKPPLNVQGACGAPRSPQVNGGSLPPQAPAEPERGQAMPAFPERSPHLSGTVHVLPSLAAHPARGGIRPPGPPRGTALLARACARKDPGTTMAVGIAFHGRVGARSRCSGTQSRDSVDKPLVRTSMRSSCRGSSSPLSVTADRAWNEPA